MRVEDFRYDLPDSAIAQTPAEPRDAARLLDSRDLTDHVFTQFPMLLEPGDLIVVNTTRVRRARLRGTRLPGGGAVELLLLERRSDGGWAALARPARRLRTGTRLRFGDVGATVCADPVDGVVTVDFDDESMLESLGTVPLPPYITTELGDPERYQTVYADRVGSAAAPTAGLHFTPEVLVSLEQRGIRRVGVDLEVGLGTFRPIATERVEEHTMHRERCTVPPDTAEAIDATRRAGGRIVAVGTTTVRTLETFAGADGKVGSGTTETALFLHPGSPFRAVDLLLTNFHVPGSSLIVMLAGFMGDGWRTAYETALARGYRFLSFGDAMLCERAR